MRNFENKEKIVQVSGGLKIVSFLIMLFLGYAIIAAPLLLLIKTTHPSGLVANIITSVLAFMVWWNFWSFFSRLNAGYLFDALTVKRLSMAGRWRIALWFFSFMDLWLKNKFAFQNQVILFDGLLFGIAIVFTAWLLREGQTMEEDQKLTV